MASSDGNPGPMPTVTEEGAVPGKAMTVGQHMIDKSAQMIQSFKPINKFSHQFCTFALYSHDLSRQIETHHFVSRLNQDVCQCAVYESDSPNARLIGVEYILSEKMFRTLSEEEQKLWHSHAYEVKSGLLVTPRIPQVIENQELQNLAKTYGKFWCTWQVDRGDNLPLGAPALMVSPQSESTIRMEVVKKRDAKYEIESEKLIATRSDIKTPEVSCYADYWKLSGKGFAIDIETTHIKTTSPNP